MMIRSALLLAALVMVITTAPVRADDEAMDRPTAPPKALPITPPAKAKANAATPAKKAASKKKDWTKEELQLAPAPLMKPNVKH